MNTKLKARLLDLCEKIKLARRGLADTTEELTKSEAHIEAAIKELEGYEN